ncbi:hypothetical protein EVAR_85453_1 [Eumeta japonica]|uniref:Uncharacterized protein n=1 Tax=Eumeta variegata TaxID=151549 RepID=A0A4C1WK63_EUMVA|nr:hypothetical protein EVAR_85453_1 [Eumeta japonica]
MNGSPPARLRRSHETFLIIVMIMRRPRANGTPHAHISYLVVTQSSNKAELFIVQRRICEHRADFNIRDILISQTHHEMDRCNQKLA